MTDDEICQLIQDHHQCSLPDSLMMREFALGLIASGDPTFLLKVPEPWRTQVITFGRTLTYQWFEISNNGMVDYSQHAAPLNSLVMRFLREVPVGQYIDWHGPKVTS